MNRLLPLSLLLLLCLSACGAGRATDADPADSLRCDSDSLAQSPAGQAEIIDHFFTRKEEYHYQATGLDFRAELEWPVGGPQTLVRGVRQAVADALGYKGDIALDDPEPLARQAYAAFRRENEPQSEEERQALQDLAAEGQQTTLDYDFEVEEQNDRYVTCQLECSAYMAGSAHPSSQEYLLTVLAETGKQMNWDDCVSRANRQQIRQIIKAAVIKQYWQGENQFDHPEALPELPSQAPALTRKGVVFSYGEYEVACYAAGRPHCTVPYNQLRTLLTPLARRAAGLE